MLCSRGGVVFSLHMRVVLETCIVIEQEEGVREAVPVLWLVPDS